MTTLYVDSETTSRADLKIVGTRTYAEHQTTRTLCWSWAIDDGPVHTWWPGDGVRTELIAAIAAGCRVVAHNFQFDFAIWHQHMVLLGWPAIPIDRWDCTMFRCRLARLPAGLDEAAKVL